MESLNPYQEYTGEKFGEIINKKNITLFIFINPEKYNFVDGLNIEPKFNKYDGSTGFYFCDEQNVLKFLNNWNTVIAEVTIPLDALVYVHRKKYQTNKIYLNKKYLFCHHPNPKLKKINLKDII